MSVVVNLLCSLSPASVSLLWLASFLLFYTMFDKTRKTLVPCNLTNVLLFTQGFDHTLVEFNKALSLSGLAVMATALLPCYRGHRSSLLQSAALQLTTHFCYSLYRYYNTKNVPCLSSFTVWNDGQSVKKLSVILGMSSLTLLLGQSFNYLPIDASALLFGMLHFCLMEIDYKYKLRVRPYAYIVFPLAAAALYYAYFS